MGHLLRSVTRPAVNDLTRIFEMRYFNIGPYRQTKSEKRLANCFLALKTLTQSCPDFYIDRSTLKKEKVFKDQTV